MANRLKAPLYAVYVQAPHESLERAPAALQRQVDRALALASQFGGVPMTFKGSDVVSTIAAFVKEYGITHIVLGRSQRAWYERFLRASILEQMIQAIHGVDILVVDTE